MISNSIINRISQEFFLLVLRKKWSRNRVYPTFFVVHTEFYIYRMHAIISCGLYFFNPFFTATFIWEQLILQSVLYFLILSYSSDLDEDAIQKRVETASILLFLLYILTSCKGKKKRGEKIESCKSNSIKLCFTSVCRALQVKSSLVKGFTSSSTLFFFSFATRKYENF